MQQPTPKYEMYVANKCLLLCALRLVLFAAVAVLMLAKTTI